MAWYKAVVTGLSWPATNVVNTLTMLNGAFTTLQADANFGWQIASFTTVTTPYLVLKRKSGAAGRLMFFGGGTGPSSNSYFSPGSNPGTTTTLVGMDNAATVDTPTQSFLVGPPFGGTNNANWKACNITPSAATVDLHAYWNAAEDILYLQFWNGTNQHCTVIVGNFLKDENGATVLGFMIQTSTGAAVWPNLGNPAPTTWTNGLAQQETWAFDPTASITGGAWIRCMQITNVTVLNSASYINDELQYTTAGGVQKFLPVRFLAMVNGFPWSFTKKLYSTRYMGYGPPKVKDHQWLDNASTPKGYYIGYTTTAGTDRSCFSLLNDTF